MINKAIEKMTMECEKYTGEWFYGPMVYLEEHYTANMTERIAEKILNDDKSLHEAFLEIKKAAERNRVGNSKCVAFSPVEGTAITDEYFGITQEDYSFKSRTPAAKDDMDDILDLM